MYVERNYYPEWFIEELFNITDRERAYSGTLKKSEKVDFCCSRNHVYKQMVSSHISPTGQKKSFCPECRKIELQNNRKYPQWFIDELVEEDDKKKAIEGSLSSTVRVKIKCPKCGYMYDTKVGTHINLTTMEQRRGCRECAREKHRQDRLEYVSSNYEKVCEVNKKVVEQQKEYYKNNPEKLVERGKKHSEYLKNNPDIVSRIVEGARKWRENNPEVVKSLVKKKKLWVKEHPEEVKKIGKKISEAKKNNPDGEKRRVEKYKELCKTTDLRKRLSEAQKKFHRDHSCDAKKRGVKISQWYKSNPEKIKIKGKKHSEYLHTHPSIIESISSKLKEHYKNKEWKENKYKKISATRTAHRVGNFQDSFLKDLENIIHPDDYGKILSGDLKSTSSVRVACPKCGSYSTHVFHNFASVENNILITIPYCEHCITKVFSSKPESEIKEYISSFYSGTVVENTRSVIKGELDLYYPEKKIAIEYNGFYWHSDQMKPKKFHFQKFYQCKKNGIRLLSIFSQDWEYKKEKVKALLSSIFNQSQIVYARKCCVREIDKDTRKEFLDRYHFDGDYRQSLYSYGLFYNNTLLAVMSFGKLRGNNQKRTQEGYYELTRLAFLEGYKVIGGASKLFKFFIKEKNPKYIVSYSDNDYFVGNMYSTLGFSFVSFGDGTLDYQWVKYKSVLNRYSCMPHILLKKYPKYKDLKIEGSIEDHIMKDLGYLKVYRCGNSIWEWGNC